MTCVSSQDGERREPSVEDDLQFYATFACRVKGSSEQPLSVSGRAPFSLSGSTSGPASGLRLGPGLELGILGWSRGQFVSKFEPKPDQLLSCGWCVRSSILNLDTDRPKTKVSR